jgi:hypothetical protein
MQPLRRLAPNGEATTAKIKLVVIAQMQSPLPPSRARLRHLHRLHQRARVAGRQRVEQVLVDLKVEHHVHVVAVLAEILPVGFGQQLPVLDDTRLS